MPILLLIKPLASFLSFIENSSFQLLFCLLQNSASSVSNEQPSENASSEDPMDKPDVPRAVKNWPQEPLKLGQVAGVSVNSALQPVIFHRGDRVWDIE